MTIFRNEMTDTSGTVLYAEVFDFDAGTVTVFENGVEVSSRPTTPEDEARFAPPPPTEADAIRLATRLTVVDKVRADALTDGEVATVAPLFDPLTAGTQVATGDVYR